MIAPSSQAPKAATMASTPYHSAHRRESESQIGSMLSTGTSCGCKTATPAANDIRPVWSAGLQATWLWYLRLCELVLLAPTSGSVSNSALYSMNVLEVKVIGSSFTVPLLLKKEAGNGF